MKTSWSFSSLLNFEKCPHTQTFPYKERNSEQAQRGIDMHSSIEAYLLGNTSECPFPNLPFGGLLDGTRTLSVEDKWGFDRDWEPTDYKTAWLRIKADTVAADTHLVTVIDYKSGKRSGNEIKHGQQTLLYMIGAACRYPTVDYFTSELWYVDHDLVYPSQEYSRDQLMKAKERWDKRGRIMTAATSFPPKPSRSNCKYCDFKLECEYAFEE